MPNNCPVVIVDTISFGRIGQLMCITPDGHNYRSAANFHFKANSA